MRGPSNKTAPTTYVIPEEDLELIKAIQSRCRRQDMSLNNSEVVRAGLAALMGLGDSQFVKRIKALNRLSRGRKSKADHLPNSR